MNKLALLAIIILLLIYAVVTLPSKTIEINSSSEIESFTPINRFGIDPTNASTNINHPMHDTTSLEENQLGNNEASSSHKPIGLLNKDPKQINLNKVIDKVGRPSIREYNTKKVKYDGIDVQQHATKMKPTAINIYEDVEAPKVGSIFYTANKTTPEKEYPINKNMGPSRPLTEENSKFVKLAKPVAGIKDESTTKNTDKYVLSNIAGLETSSEECNASVCSSGTCGSGSESLHPILDPRFNMREVAKQALLLEDHINNENKRCFDCIRKHFLITDGLLEEAVSLEQDMEKRSEYRNMYLRWVALEKEYSLDPLNKQNMDNISKKIRLFRKPLVEKYFDLVKEYDLSSLDSNIYPDPRKKN